MTESGTSNFNQTFDAANRMQGWSYDASGDLLNDGSHSYTYDAEGRIKTVDGTAATYTYGPDGERVRKDTTTGSTEYIYFGSQMIAELNPATGAWTDYIFAGGKRIAKDTSNNGSGAQYYQGDHLGSTRIMTDASGIVISNCTYAPYGEEVSCSPNNISNHYKFTGKERDSESGLDYFGARYNSSGMGRFLTPDSSDIPVAVPFANLFDAQTLNLYTYVRNNPLNGTDPTGHYEVNASGCSGRGQAKCQKKYDKRVKNFEKQRQKDLKSKDPRVRAAAAAFGNQGYKNGVHVGFADLASKGEKGEVDGVTNNGKGKVIDIEVTIDSHLGGKSLQETIAHEGTHVEDHINFLTSYDFSTGKYDPAANLTHGQTEFNAFQAGAAVTHEHGFGPNDTQKIYNYLRSSPQYQNVLNIPLYPNDATFPQ